MTPLLWDASGNGNVGGGDSLRQPRFAEWHDGGVERSIHALIHVPFTGFFTLLFTVPGGVKNGVKYIVKKGVKNVVKMRGIDPMRAIAVPAFSAISPVSSHGPVSRSRGRTRGCGRNQQAARQPTASIDPPRPVAQLGAVDPSQHSRRHGSKTRTAPQPGVSRRTWVGRRNGRTSPSELCGRSPSSCEVLANS